MLWVYFLSPVHMSDMSHSSQNGNPWFSATIGLLGLIVGYVVANAVHGYVPAAPAMPSAPTGGVASSSAAPSYNPPSVGDNSPVLGKDDAPVTIIEFTDFQCPFCQRHYQQTFGQIKKDLVDSGKVKYVLRMFPLSSIHPNAEKAAEGALCAFDQKKFWEMHDKLFTTQQDWSSADAATFATTLKKYATDLGMDGGAFEKCLSSGSKAAQVQADTAAGSASGINGTPGFWILGPNGKNQQISGAYPYTSFTTAVDTVSK